MKKYNIIIVYSPDESRVLMCRREKDPYKGLLNFVGGKVEGGEDELAAAYRELYEETGIGETDIRLTHAMDFQYYLSGFELQVFAGKLLKDVPLHKEVNELLWISVTENFCDTTRFAGEGNIAHMLLRLDCFKDILF